MLLREGGGGDDEIFKHVSNDHPSPRRSVDRRPENTHRGPEAIQGSGADSSLRPSRTPDVSHPYACARLVVPGSRKLKPNHSWRRSCLPLRQVRICGCSCYACHSAGPFPLRSRVESWLPSLSGLYVRIAVSRRYGLGSPIQVICPWSPQLRLMKSSPGETCSQTQIPDKYFPQRFLSNFHAAAARFGQMPPNVCKAWPTLAKLGQHVATLHHHESTPGTCWTSLTTRGQVVAKFGGRGVKNTQQMLRGVLVEHFRSILRASVQRLPRLGASVQRLERRAAMYPSEYV